jgi:hypothetical protein
MATVTDLLSTVYDFLTAQFAPTAGGSTFLQIGWPGVSLSPADFKPFDNPTGPYNPQQAEETVSSLVNVVPTCNALRFENSGCEIDDLYQILVEEATPPTAEVTLFSDARYEFLNARRGCMNDPNLFYYPCRVSPTEWYSEINAQSWSTYAVSANQVKSVAPQAPFIKLGGTNLVKAGVLRTLPAGMNPAVLASNLKAGVDRKASNFQPRVPLGGVGRRPVAPHTIQPVVMGVGGGSGSPHPAPTPKAVLKPSFLGDRITKVGLPAVDARKFEILRTKNLTFNQNLFLRNILQEQLVPKPVEDQTTGFSISFKYCMVTITRSWLKFALLSTRNWYMIGTDAGYYSQGKIDNNPGLFTMIPYAFVAIRDLVISAKWSSTDSTAVSQSKSFGPFDLGSATFNQGTIQAKQLQVIAWLSRLTPVLPPLKDPSLP